MSDVYCRRCGEPWDCTGGLTYTKQSMSWWEFEQLRLGLGCPCCEGEWHDDLKEDETFICSWRWRWMYACEGDQPYSSFPAEPRQSDLPKWYAGSYRNGRDAPSLYDVLGDSTALADITFDRLELLYTDADEFYSEYLEEANASIWLKDFVAEHVSRHCCSDLVLRANYVAIERSLNEEGLKYMTSSQGFRVCTGEVKEGNVRINDKAVAYVCDWERALSDYPLADDMVYSEMENEENDDGADE